MPENRHKYLAITYYTCLLLSLSLIAIIFVQLLFPGQIISFVKSRCSINSITFYTKLILKNLSCYQLITACLFLLNISGFIFKKFYVRIISELIDGFILFNKEICHKLKSGIINEEKFHIICISLIFLSGVAIRLAFLNRPIMYDESFTFLEYAKNSFVNTISNYSYPNNHIFHTILVKICYSLFGGSLFAIRLPAFISGILLIPFSYLFCRKFYCKETALIAILFIASSGLLINYSTNARGYMIICVFFIFILLLLDNLKNAPSLFKWWLYVLCSSLGFYTIPTFLYSHIIIIFIAFIPFRKSNYYKFQFFKKIFYAQIAIAVTVFIMYLPVLMFSGAESIIANDAVSPINYNDWSSNIAESIFSTFNGWFFNFPVPVIILLLAGFLIFFFLSGAVKKLKWFLLGFLIILLILFLQKVIPPQRIWVFLCAPFLSICASGLFILINKINLKIFFWKKYFFNITAVLIAFALSINIYFFGNDEEPGFTDNEAIAAWLSNNLHNNDRLIAGIPIDYPLEFYLEKHNINYFQLRDKNKYSRLLVVVNSYFNQNVNEILKKEVKDSQLFSEPEIIKKFKFSTIYSIPVKTILIR